MNPFALTERKIFITGASSGIGRATAQMAAEMGALCILNGRDERRLNDTLSSLLPNIKYQHTAYPEDITRNDSRNLVAKIVKEVGPIDGFVHCAGIEKTLPFRATDLDDLREVMAINVESFWTLTQAILRKGNYSEGISIVGISSVAAIYGAAGKSAYTASKGALISLIKTLAAEYSSQKIRFNCVCPGYVDTPMLSQLKNLYKNEQEYKESMAQWQPLGVGKPEDVATAVIYLLSAAARWVTGSAISVDGGYGGK